MVAARSGRIRPIRRRLAESARTHEFIQLYRFGRPQHIFARSALSRRQYVFFRDDKTILFHVPSVVRSTHNTYMFYYIYWHVTIFFCYYIIIYFAILYIGRYTLFFILLFYYSHKTLSEHNANKVLSLEFYVREPNPTDPLSLSLSNYIIYLSLVLYILPHVYVPTAAGPADTVPAVLYL